MTRAIRWFPLLALAGSLACARSDTDSPKGGAPASTEATRFARELDVDLSAMTKSPTGLYWRDLVVGTGAEVVKGQQVSVHYSGSFPDGRIFDANQGSDPPFSFTPGQRRVIDGWEEGVVGMRVGGKRQLVVPPTLGYGPDDYGPIPGGSTLVFTVEVVSVP